MTTDTTRNRGALPQFSTLFVTSFLVAVLVIVGAIVFLSRGLSDQTVETLNYSASDFKFAFGSGQPSDDFLLVDGFANGYALLTSGPVSIQADKQRLLRYRWLPPKPLQEAAFFWRRIDDAQNVQRTDIILTGKHLIDLSTEPEWTGEITEFGFLLAGDNGEAVELGNTSLMPDSLKTRLQFTWYSWSTFEEWSQQSINFLYGGNYRRAIPLPLLVTAWLLTTLLLLGLFLKRGKHSGSRQMLVTAGLIFLVAWMALDIRWSANNIRQIQRSFQTYWQADEQQRPSKELDGKIYEYIQRLKDSVLDQQPARILILGDSNSVDYYLLKAKYHLLPNSAHVAGQFARELTPQSLDFVIFFGEPADIAKVPGWTTSWQKSLVQVHREDLGVVFRLSEQGGALD